MLPTFVIGLREGLEAALIVGIIAAFLRKQGRRDLLRWVFLGVGVAVLLCVAAGVALDVLSHDLPQRQQERLETVIGALAVAMVTYMVVWMKRNSRGLKGQLEGLAADAVGGSSGAARAMIAMAFLAVLREGVETVVFLLAAFNQSAGGASSALGACLGLAVAIALGYGIYRGGVRINLSKFFRATGLVLVLVAAGILVNALHTAHEAGWLNAGQQGTVDLSGLVRPGSVQASLLTGMLGLQAHPVLVEILGWLIYLVPVGLYLAWPPGRGPSRRTMARALGAAAGLFALVAGALALLAPARPEAATAGTRVVSLGASATVGTSGDTVTLHRSGTVERDGLSLARYTSRSVHAGPGSPARLSYARIADLNGGRLPIGLTPTGADAAVRYAAVAGTTVLIEPRTARVVEFRTTTRVAATVEGFALAHPVRTTTSGWSAATSRAALAQARDAVADIDRRDTMLACAWTAGVLALLAAAGTGALVLRRRAAPVPGAPPAVDPVPVTAR
jgi:high-affinity iron transporter